MRDGRIVKTCTECGREYYSDTVNYNYNLCPGCEVNREKDCSTSHAMLRQQINIMASVLLW